MTTSHRSLEFSILADGLDHAECVTVAPDGTVVAGGEAGQVYHVSPDGQVAEVARIEGAFALGVCLDGDGRVYMCDMRGGAVRRLERDGSVTTYADGDGQRRVTSPNYAVFDEAGNLYFSDNGGWKADDGCLWAVRPDGSCAVLREDVTDFPNGLALDPSGRYLYAIESLGRRVVRVRVTPEGESVGPVEPVVELPAETLPDGLAFDEAGGLWIACYTPDRIYRLAPEGMLELVAEDLERVTLASPTNLAFAGEDRRRLVAANLARWHLSVAHVDVPGMALRYPRLRREDAR